MQNDRFDINFRKQNGDLNKVYRYLSVVEAINLNYRVHGHTL